MKSLIWKLLRRNISKWQIGGYAVATFVGLAIVLVAVQLYSDVHAAWEADESEATALAAARNIVISKPVGLTSTLTGRSPSFSEMEIEEIEAQPWSKRVSRFQAADFGVYAGVEIGGRGMSTALFFESVPDDLVDIDRRQWRFDSINPSIPIVLSKDYLTLYNLGFAASGRMPMVSESVLKTIPLRIVISGNGHADTFPGHIVGFSSWLNTIAVPQDFMDWAHRRYGKGDTEPPTRLVVEASETDRPAALEYMRQNDYDVAGPAADSGRASYLLNLITAVVVAIGGVITVLAIFILVLSLYLLVQKNRKSISGLLLLGYTPGAVSASYIRLVVIVNVSITVLAIVAMLVASNAWAPALESIGTASAAPWMSIAVGVGIMAAVTAVNVVIIRRLVASCFRG